MALVIAATDAGAQVAPDAAASIGRDVRITLTTGGAETGRLIGLTATDVTIGMRKGRDVTDRRYLLADVTRVETVPHETRNFALLGAIAGMVVALSVDLCGGGRAYGNPGPPGEPGCLTPAPLLLTIGGAGLGAMIGKPLDDRDRRVLYGPPASRSRTTSVAPIVGPARGGVQFQIAW